MVKGFSRLLMGGGSDSSPNEGDRCNSEEAVDPRLRFLKARSSSSSLAMSVMPRRALVASFSRLTSALIGVGVSSESLRTIGDSFLALVDLRRGVLELGLLAGSERV